MAKERTRQKAHKVDLISLNRAYPDHTLDLEGIDWISVQAGLLNEPGMS